MIKIYKCDNNGEVTIESDCQTALSFWSDLAGALARLITEQPTEEVTFSFKGDEEYCLNSLLENAWQMALKIEGYKSEGVKEVVLRYSGFSSPEGRQPMVAYGRFDPARLPTLIDEGEKKPSQN